MMSLDLQKHAKAEFEVLGWPGNCEMQKMMCDQVLELLEVFGNHGHSGSSAPYAVSLFKKLAMFEPIAPLTGEDSEWGEPYDSDGTQQNRRCSHVFKEKDGRACDISAVVFREPNGCCYTGKGSCKYITFPYTPRTRYVDSRWWKRWLDAIIEAAQPQKGQDNEYL